MAGRKPKPEWQASELLRVAEMYYIHDLKQSEIADLTPYTRHEVGDMLRLAKERKIVQIQITTPIEYSQLRHYEEQLCQSYSVLQDAIVVPGHDAISHAFSPNPKLSLDATVPSKTREQVADYIREGIVLSIAKAAARYVGEILAHNDTIIVGRGHMVKTWVASIESPELLEKLKILPMQGFLQATFDAYDANVIASDLQKIIGGKYLWMPIPAIASTEQRAVLSEIEGVRKVFRTMEKASIVMTSLGSLTWQKKKRMIRLGFPKEEIRALSARIHNTPDGIPRAGEIGGWLFDENGIPITDEVSWSPIGFDLEKMQHTVTEKQGRVICAAGADKDRFVPLRAALQGGFFNVLVTDHVTAQWLITNKPLADKT